MRATKRRSLLGKCLHWRQITAPTYTGRQWRHLWRYYRRPC